MNGYYLIVHKEKPPPWKAGQPWVDVCFFDIDNHHQMTDIFNRYQDMPEHRAYELGAKYILRFQFGKDFPPEIYCRVGKEIWDLNHPKWNGWVTPEFIQEALDRVLARSFSFT